MKGGLKQAEKYTPKALEGVGLRARRAEAAMYKSSVTRIEDYVDIIKSGDKKQFFHLGPVSRKEIGISDVQIELTPSSIELVLRRHSDFSDWGKIYTAIQQGQITPLGFSGRTNSKNYGFKISVGEQDLLVIAAPVTSGKKGIRLQVNTTFIDSPAAIADWLSRNKTAFP